MRHTFLKVLLTFGLVGGLIAGFAGCHHHGHHGHHGRYEYMEQKVTDICTTAVKDAMAEERRAHPTPPPPPPSYPAAAPAPPPPSAPAAATAE